MSPGFRILGAGMTEEVILEKLHEIVRNLGIICRRCDGEFEGGFFRKQNQWFLMLNSSISAEREIELLCQALANFDLSDRFLLPVLRKRIEVRKSGPDQAQASTW